MSAGLLDIVFENRELLVLNKPAGLVCHPTKGDATSSLVGRVRQYLGEAAEQHLINRLDRETSGVVLVGKSATLARGVRRLWEQRAVTKEYLAIVHGDVDAPGTEPALIDLPLGKDTASEIAIKDCVRPDGHPSATEFRVLARFEVAGKKFSLLRVSPLSGRKHQIRIHLAHIGHPIVGDKLYGGDELIYLRFVKGELTDADRTSLVLENQGLHAFRVSFRFDAMDFQFSAPVPAEFRAFLPESIRSFCDEC